MPPEVNYYVLIFPVIVLVIGIIGKGLMVIGKGTCQDEAMENFEEKLDWGGSMKGKELHTKNYNNSSDKQ